MPFHEKAFRFKLAASIPGVGGLEMHYPSEVTDATYKSLKQLADDLGMKIVQAEREGRIIILYHSIAMAVVAIETYMITGLLKMKPFFKTAINSMITVGYLVTMIFGMGFAYFGHNWAFHGLYITGLSLIFFAGVLLCIALYPWNVEYYVIDKDYAHTPMGVDLERVAFFATAVTTLLSSLFGAVPGSYFGHGFETFTSPRTSSAIPKRV